jgi:hypothetical protein
MLPPKLHERNEFLVASTTLKRLLFQPLFAFFTILYVAKRIVKRIVWLLMFRKLPNTITKGENMDQATRSKPTMARLPKEIKFYCYFTIIPQLVFPSYKIKFVSISMCPAIKCQAKSTIISRSATTVTTMIFP